MIFRTAIFIASLAASFPLWAGPPTLSLPIDCDLGTTCFIQNYVDANPGPSAQDFQCGALTYDGHRGTDIRLAHRDQILGNGVAVLASSSGKVVAIRDSLPDIAQGDTGAPDVSGVECGNGVLLDHGDGWRTQYCHMRSGSVWVKPGQTIKQGAPLGLVGLSGRTEFPHVHVKVTLDNEVVDPFRPDGAKSCTSAPTSQLWSPPLSYLSGGVLSAGITVSPPKFSEIRQGLRTTKQVDQAADALIVWGYFFGAQSGDAVTITLRNPAGALIVNRRFNLDRTQAEAFRFAGKRPPTGGWLTGVYSATLTLTRDGQKLAQENITTEVR